jgi:hypothetical protein
MNPYEKLISRKRKWTPVAVTGGPVADGTEDAISRCLALRCLEIPVGDFIKEASAKEIPEHARKILSMNITDEENHDLALNYVAATFDVDAKTTEEAQSIAKAWISHPDHPIVKAMVLERSIFFTILPFFRAFGNDGMRTTSADISRDEQIHVATNSLVCAELGLSPSPSLDKLRKATSQWLYLPLQGDKKLATKFWTDSSDRLMYQGKAPELSFTRSARMPAFFEHNNVNLPKYA